MKLITESLEIKFSTRGIPCELVRKKKTGSSLFFSSGNCGYENYGETEFRTLHTHTGGGGEGERNAQVAACVRPNGAQA